jgi:hypothetical protein
MENDRENYRVNVRENDTVNHASIKKRVPPSRIKYEKSHPVMSIRVNEAEKKEIMSISSLSGKSAAQIIKEALFTMRQETETAYKKGLEDGIGRFKIPCSICGKPMSIDTKKNEEAKLMVLKALNAWVHGNCHKEKRHRDEEYAKAHIKNYL